MSQLERLKKFATNSVDTKKSFTGYVFTEFGTAIKLKGNLQKDVALSTTEAEYIAMTEAVNKAFLLAGLLKGLKIMQDVITIFRDNQCAIQLSRNQVFRDRRKHVHIKLHFIREELRKGTMKIEQISAEENPSDMITKSLPRNKFDQHCLGLIKLKDN